MGGDMARIARDLLVGVRDGKPAEDLDEAVAWLELIAGEMKDFERCPSPSP